MPTRQGYAATANPRLHICPGLSSPSVGRGRTLGAPSPVLLLPVPARDPETRTTVSLRTGYCAVSFDRTSNPQQRLPWQPHHKAAEALWLESGLAGTWTPPEPDWGDLTTAYLVWPRARGPGHQETGSEAWLLLPAPHFLIGIMG